MIPIHMIVAFVILAILSMVSIAMRVIDKRPWHGSVSFWFGLIAFAITAWLSRFDIIPIIQWIPWILVGMFIYELGIDIKYRETPMDSEWGEDVYDLAVKREQAVMQLEFETDQYKLRRMLKTCKDSALLFAIQDRLNTLSQREHLHVVK